MSAFGPFFDPNFRPPVDPTDRALAPGDAISNTETLFIVAAGPNVGRIGTAQALATAYPGVATVEEDSDFDPITYPDLSRFLRPYQGYTHVPRLSTPAWL